MKVFEVFPIFSAQISGIKSCDYSLDAVNPSELNWGGEFSHQKVSLVKFMVSAGELHPIYLSNIIGWPIFQNDFVGRVGWVNEGNEMFSVRSSCPLLDKYGVLKINNFLNIIDKKKSDIEWSDSGSIRFIRNLVISPADDLQQTSIFRLSSYKSPFFVTETLLPFVKEFSREELGFELREIEMV